jgi:integrase
MGKLTKLAVDKLRDPGRYSDGQNLWLQISKNGGKSWLLRYQIDGRARHMGLGPVELVTLAEARDRAHELRRDLARGIDPIEARNAERAERQRTAAASVTFKQAAFAVIEGREAKWSRESLRQWRSTLEQYAFPIMGSLPVAVIDTPLVLKCVEPVWKRTEVTADRLRQRIEAILDWSTARAYRSGDNPARWRGHLQHVLQRNAEKQHLAAMPYSDVPGFVQTLRRREGIPARALEFAILTAARAGEVLGATWGEVEGALWTIPGERMKAGKQHVVPLCRRAIELLAGLPREGKFVFAGAKAGHSLERHAMRDTLRAMGFAVTAHGFRSSFRDWASEATAFAPHVCEMALAHAIPNAVEKAYRRGDLLDKRRELMDAWAEFLG